MVRQGSPLDVWQPPVEASGPVRHDPGGPPRMAYRLDRTVFLREYLAFLRHRHWWARAPAIALGTLLMLSAIGVALPLRGLPLERVYALPFLLVAGTFILGLPAARARGAWRSTVRQIGGVGARVDLSVERGQLRIGWKGGENRIPLGRFAQVERRRRVAWLHLDSGSALIVPTNAAVEGSPSSLLAAVEDGMAGPLTGGDEAEGIDPQVILAQPDFLEHLRWGLLAAYRLRQPVALAVSVLPMVCAIAVLALAGDPLQIGSPELIVVVIGLLAPLMVPALVALRVWRVRRELQALGEPRRTFTLRPVGLELRSPLGTVLVPYHRIRRVYRGRLTTWVYFGLTPAVLGPSLLLQGDLEAFLAELEDRLRPPEPR